jgi:hypothetical protein
MRRLRAVVTGVVAGIVGGTSVLLALATCTPPALPPGPPPQPDQAGSPAHIATSNGPFRAGPVAPPASGALVGAWVRPETLTPLSRVEAVSTLENAIGRRLDLVNTYRKWDEPLVNDSDVMFAQRGSTVMLSWASGDTRSITMGRHDELIRDQARKVKAYGRPLLVRFRWEMDRPGLAAAMWSPDDYIAAWRHVRNVFRAEHVTNVSWVWCPTVEGFQGGYATPFYPGDNDVDWVCVDVYAGSKFTPIGELLRPFLRWAADHPTKPIMIGEFGVARVWRSDQRVAWLRDAGEVFQANPQIRAVLYFESDPEGNPAEQQFTLAGDPPALSAFADLARRPYFNPRRRSL